MKLKFKPKVRKFPSGAAVDPQLTRVKFPTTISEQYVSNTAFSVVWGSNLWD